MVINIENYEKIENLLLKKSDEVGRYSDSVLDHVEPKAHMKLSFPSLIHWIGDADLHNLQPPP